jgi:hypothetical protein
MVNVYGAPNDTSLANMSSNIDLTAQDPGDIVIYIDSSDGGHYTFPVKAMTAEKTVEVNPVYGTGSHQAYQAIYGKVSYKGSFTINTWLSKDDKTMLNTLLFDTSDEGIPLIFNISVIDRGTDADATGGSPILTFTDCSCTNYGIDIGEPGNAIGTKYDFVALRMSPL